jgi:hypothetical protein
MSRKESDIQRAILDYLKARGIMAHKQAGQTLGIDSKGETYRRKSKDWDQGGTNGISDISGILPGGRSLRIEVKKPGEKPSGAQSSYLQMARVMGAVAFVAYSVDDVERELEREGRKG